MRYQVAMAAKGRYAWQVLENGVPVKSSDFADNYIFDSGLDMLAARTWAQCFEVCHLGSQNNPTESTALGTAKLQDHQKWSNTYYGGAIPAPFNFSGCGTINMGSGLKLRRTFDFPDEGVDTTYTEIGWSPYSGANDPLFSRVVTKISGSHEPIDLLAGQALRIVYELEILTTPNNESVTNPITGWNSNGNSSIQLYGLSAVVSGTGATKGASTFFDVASGANEPSRYSRFFLSNVATPVSTMGSYVDRSAGGPYDFGGGNAYTSFALASSYTPGSFTLTKRTVINSIGGVHDGYRSIGIGGGSATLGERPALDGARYNSFVHVLGSSVAKALNYVLRVDFIFSWSRQ